MIRDALLTFSNNQAVAAGPSTNVIDLGPLSGGNTSRQIGAGVPLFVAMVFPVAVTGVLDVSIQTSDSDTSGWATVSTTSLPTTATAAGKKSAIALPLTGLKRYLRLNYATATAGTIWAGIVQDVGDSTLYQGGFKMPKIKYTVAP